MSGKRVLHWYTLFPYARLENILTLKLIREQYDSMFRALADYQDGWPFVNTPLFYALVKESDVHIFEEMEHTALYNGDTQYLESGSIPQILAIAEERELQVFNHSPSLPSSSVQRASLVRMLENRGSILDGWDDTFDGICTSGTLARALCDCSQGVPTLTPIVVTYQAPAVSTAVGHLTDMTAFYKLSNRASSL